ncbi:hypothetical protein [Veillonella sp. AM51-8BH]
MPMTKDITPIDIENMDERTRMSISWLSPWKKLARLMNLEKSLLVPFS